MRLLFDLGSDLRRFRRLDSPASDIEALHPLGCKST